MKTTTFICGCGHSGTTLLASMFAAHPDTYVPLRETRTFRPARKFEIERRWEKLLSESESESEYKHLVEKTPRHIYRLDAIRIVVRRTNHRPRFILMVRDGRDVVTSLIKREYNFYEASKRWYRDSAKVKSELSRKDTILVRYEDLIKDTEGTLRRLCEFCAIPYSEEMPNFHQREFNWYNLDVPSHEPLPNQAPKYQRVWQINQPIFDGRGQWKKVLTTDELLWFETKKIRSLMEFYGYK